MSAGARTGFVAHLGSAAPPYQPRQKATLSHGEGDLEESLTPPEAPPPAHVSRTHGNHHHLWLGGANMAASPGDVCLLAAILWAPTLT